jgi:hypothetical protein
VEEVVRRGAVACFHEDGVEQHRHRPRRQQPDARPEPDNAEQRDDQLEVRLEVSQRTAIQTHFNDPLPCVFIDGMRPSLK